MKLSEYDGKYVRLRTAMGKRSPGEPDMADRIFWSVNTGETKTGFSLEISWHTIRRSNPLRKLYPMEQPNCGRNA